MPVLNKLAKIAVKPLPRMISPNAHAVMDYLTAGSFLVAAAVFFPRNKRASLGSLLCGVAGIAVSLLTDYPGGMSDVMTFREHRELELGLAGMAATLPAFMGFEDDAEKKFFLAQGALITMASELTRPPELERKLKRRKAA